jgi:hypothetical protein
MGELINDLLMIVGILPIARPDKVPNLNGIKIEGKTNSKKLEELNGKHIWISDIHNGILYGRLNYIPLFPEKYFLENINGTEESKQLNVHDLETIF